MSIEQQITLNLLYDHAPEVLISLSGEGIIKAYNIRAEELFKYSKQDCLDKSFPELFLTPSSLQTFFAEVQKLKKKFTGAIFNHQFELIGRRKDQTEFPFEILLTVIYENGELGLHAVIRDLTLIKKQATDLDTANEFLNAIVDNIPDMIFVKEAKELRFTRLNKAGEELLGFKREELIGKNDFDLFPKTEADFFTSIDRSVLRTKSVVEIAEEPVATKFKGQRLLHTKKVTIFDDNNQPKFLLGISEDITEKKQASETQKKLWQEQQARIEAERALQLREDFISIAAHELRTPLTTLSLQVQLLNKFVPHIEVSQSDKFMAMLNNSQSQINRFEKLKDDMLDVSRASAGILVLEKTKEDLSLIVSNLIKTFEPRISKSHCEINLDLHKHVIGHWDKFRLEQVIGNLINNALKYGAGKLIEISTQIQNDKAIFSIRDHGIGIAKEDQERIFNRFERAVSVKKYGGLGLGLYIADQIITAHGGRIHVQSELGHGAQFTIELPL